MKVRARPQQGIVETVPKLTKTVIALGVDAAAAVVRRRHARQSRCGGENLPRRRPDRSRVQRLGRALDVREQEGDRAADRSSDIDHPALKRRAASAQPMSSHAEYRNAPVGRYQPRVSSSSFGSSVAVEIPTIASPSPSETRASTAASM